MLIHIDSEVYRYLHPLLLNKTIYLPIYNTFTFSFLQVAHSYKISNNLAMLLYIGSDYAIDHKIKDL